MPFFIQIPLSILNDLSPSTIKAIVEDLEESELNPHLSPECAQTLSYTRAILLQYMGASGMPV